MTELLVCAHCRVLVEPAGDNWQHVPAFAVKFDRAVCDRPAPGRAPSGSEARFGLARIKQPGGDKHTARGQLPELDLPAGTPVTVAVDGSYKLTVGAKVTKAMAWAYLATNGMWGLGTSIVPGSVVGDQRALQAELRAIANALQALDPSTPATILCDSRQALGFLTLWRDGHDVMPGGYHVERSGGRESTLAKLARRIRESNGRIEWDWVRGHAGHPLNEGADALAKMSRAWTEGRLERDVVVAGAPTIVRAALSRHTTGCAA